MKLVKVALAVVVIALGGCAHSINVAPNAAKIEREAGSPPKIMANVGYHIPAEADRIEVVTPGGGGDSVRYFPYRDFEAAYRMMLTNVFQNVIKLKSATDTSAMSAERIKYVVSPELITNSGSTNSITWRPTNFTVDLTCKVRDTSGELIANPRVVGNGQATSADSSDRGIVGKLAMEDALMKMQRALLETKFAMTDSSFSAPSPTTALAKDQISDRLEKLQGLYSRSLITREEFEKKKKEILDGL